MVDPPNLVLEKASDYRMTIEETVRAFHPYFGDDRATLRAMQSAVDLIRYRHDLILPDLSGVLERLAAIACAWWTWQDRTIWTPGLVPTMEAATIGERLDRVPVEAPACWKGGAILLDAGAGFPFLVAEVGVASIWARWAGRTVEVVLGDFTTFSVEAGSVLKDSRQDKILKWLLAFSRIVDGGVLPPRRVGTGARSARRGSGLRRLLWDLRDLEVDAALERDVGAWVHASDAARPPTPRGFSELARRLSAVEDPISHDEAGSVAAIVSEPDVEPALSPEAWRAGFADLWTVSPTDGRTMDDLGPFDLPLKASGAAAEILAGLAARFPHPLTNVRWAEAASAVGCGEDVLVDLLSRLHGGGNVRTGDLGLLDRLGWDLALARRGR